MISWKEDLRQIIFAHVVIQPTFYRYQILSDFPKSNLSLQQKRYLSLKRRSCQEDQCDDHCPALPPSHPAHEAEWKIFCKKTQFVRS